MEHLESSSITTNFYHVGSKTITEALQKRLDLFGSSMMDDVAAYAIGFAIFVGSWIVGTLVEYGLWYLLMFNWRRLCCCAKKGDSDAWNKKYTDHDESANKDRRLPVGPIPGDGKPSLVTFKIEPNHPKLIDRRRINLASIGLEQTTPPVHPDRFEFKNVPSLKATDSNRWYGHKRTRYESYVRLIVLSARVTIVIAGVVFSFRAAGVNILSLAASLGIVSICFSYGAASLLRNILNAMYMYGTDKLEMGDYVRIGNYYGIVSAMRAQWLEITDDLHPWHGRQVHQIANNVPMETICTVYPNGPPPEVIQQYFTELAQVNKWRTTEMNLEPLPQISFLLE